MLHGLADTLDVLLTSISFCNVDAHIWLESYFSINMHFWLCYIIALLTCPLQLLHKNVVIFPSRAVAIENALRLFSPRLAIVDEHLIRHLPRQWLTSLTIEVCCICYSVLLSHLVFLRCELG